MMAAIFTAMLLALGFGSAGWPRLALLPAAAGLGLAVWLFLYEINSPEYGFSIPWLQW
jgi:hypothetical protein